MPLYHNDDQTMLKDSVAPFVAEQAPVSHLRKLRDSADATGFSRDLWAQFTEMGLPGMLVPEAHGGLGMGHMEAGIVLEEIGRNLTPVALPVRPAVGAVDRARRRRAKALQPGRWLPADRQPARRSPRSRSTRARSTAPTAIALDRPTRAGNGFQLSTARRASSRHGHVADLSVVAARTDGCAGRGGGRHPVRGRRQGGQGPHRVDPRRLADASLASAPHASTASKSTADAVIGEVDQRAGAAPRRAARRGPRRRRRRDCSASGGGAMDMTVAYLRERKQFGASDRRASRALQHRAAHLYARDGGRARRRCSRRSSCSTPASRRREARRVSVAKAKAGRAAHLRRAAKACRCTAASA